MNLLSHSKNTRKYSFLSIEIFVFGASAFAQPDWCCLAPTAGWVDAVEMPYFYCNFDHSCPFFGPQCVILKPKLYDALPWTENGRQRDHLGHVGVSDFVKVGKCCPSRCSQR